MTDPRLRDRYPAEGRRSRSAQIAYLAERKSQAEAFVAKRGGVWPTWLRWFERANVFQFWQVQVAGGEPALVKHWTRRRAEREAVRLAIKLQQPVYVTHTVACAVPRRPPVPAVELMDAVTGESEWFNHPQEVEHLTARERKDQWKRVEFATSRGLT